MAAYGVQVLIKGEHLFRMANKATSVSLEGFDGLHGAFVAPLHKVRKQPFQEVVAAQVRDMIEGSEIIFRDKPQVQDPYSFRCSPQVHGASGQWIAFVKQVVENEISSVTDNPTVFEEEDLVVSGGNFHGQSMALALDSLAIALAELGSISERRTYKLISGQRGLPAFLVKNPGVNSGFMIPQYTAASIVSQNKQFCTPASIDSIDSSNGQEDHVSMGANAATKCYKVVENLEKILGIEFLNAFQAIEFRDQKSAPKIKAMQIEFRKLVPFVTDDVLMRDLIIKAIEFVKL
jgi:histidine ammonia-lyase